MFDMINKLSGTYRRRRVVWFVSSATSRFVCLVGDESCGLSRRRRVVSFVSSATGFLPPEMCCGPWPIRSLTIVMGLLLLLIVIYVEHN